MNRAFSILDIKSFDDDQRIIEGVATTPTPDRVGDVVVPGGAKFALPMPLLWQHKSGEPIGQVTFAKIEKDGIPFRAKIAKTDIAGKLKDRLDEAWQSIKLGLVRAVSIGFNPTKTEMLKDGSGFEFQEWEWLELSAVTIPANAEANITTIRSIDSELRAATGNTQIESSLAGDTAKIKTVKKVQPKIMAKQTIAEQISAFEAKRVALTERNIALMNEVADKGETLDTAQQEEYDTNETDVANIDGHLVRLRKLDKSNKAAAVEVNGESTEVATTTRGSGVIKVQSAAPAGIGFARVVLSKIAGRGSNSDAAEFARKHWPSNPEVELAVKSAVAVGDTLTGNWAPQLTPYQNLAGEFIDYLRPLTVIGRVPGFHRVPFNVSIPRQTNGTTGHWVGEGKAKPLGALAFDTVTLRWAKIAGIVAFTEELARFSNPAVEALVRDDLASGIAKFMDEQFFDASVSANSNLNPASITNAAEDSAASGVTIEDVIADVKLAFAEFQSGLIPITGSVWVMEPNQAVALSMMQNPLGQQAFPGINVNGGILMGLPVFTSENVGTGNIVLFKPSEVLLADDGGVAVDVSREASLQLNDNPTDGATTAAHVSLWQSNMIAVRAERFINWVVRRPHAVYLITDADYGGAAT